MTHRVKGGKDYERQPGVISASRWTQKPHRAGPAGRGREIWKENANKTQGTRLSDTGKLFKTNSSG